jgi:hypothetical protein
VGRIERGMEQACLGPHPRQASRKDHARIKHCGGRFERNHPLFPKDISAAGRIGEPIPPDALRHCVAAYDFGQSALAA